MNIDDICMYYEFFIRKCNNCERYAIDAANADVMRNLYGAFYDSYQNVDVQKEQIYNQKCNEVAKYLIDAIRKSSFPKEVQNGLIGDLNEKTFFSIIYVLGEIDALNRYANKTK